MNRFLIVDFLSGLSDLEALSHRANNLGLGWEKTVFGLGWEKTLGLGREGLICIVGRWVGSRQTMSAAL